MPSVVAGHEIASTVVEVDSGMTGSSVREFVTTEPGCAAGRVASAARAMEAMPAQPADRHLAGRR